MIIHPTAIVDKTAELDDSVEIGPYSIIGKNAKIGKNSIIMSNVNIMEYTEVGENNIFHMNCVVGNEPQHTGYKYCVSKVIIGNNNVIRESVSIHKGLKEGNATIIGNNNYLMGYCHIGHDVVIGNYNIIANTAALAGHVVMGSYNFMSGFSGAHQFTRISDYTMISGMTRIGKDIPPYMIVEGNCEIRGINIIGLKRRGFTAEQIKEIKNAYRILYRSKLNITQAIAKLKSQNWSEAGQRLIDFIMAPSKRGLARHYKGSVIDITSDSEKQ